MFWLGVILLVLIIAVGGYFLIIWLARTITELVFRNFLKLIMTDKYDENLWEFVSATYRHTPQIITETNLRSQEGKTISRPLGTPKRMPGLESLMFSPAQLYVMPTHLKAPIDLKVTVGPKAKKPMDIDIPIMISGMAFGEALSKAGKIAIAAGAARAGTAVCSGEGPFLPEERAAAKKYIQQYNRGDWSKEPEILSQADAIEIQFGQGAIAGVGHSTSGKQMDETLRQAFKYPPGKTAVAHSRQPEVQHPSQLPKLFRKLRDITGGAPIGAKLAPGMMIEKDLELLLAAEPDFIVIDGGEAATKGSAPILQDDFCLPLVFALPRAVEFLEKQGVRKEVTVVAAGRLRTPGEFLKAIALGADAVYIASAALFAVSHTQVLKSLPLEPPTQIIWYDGKNADQFDINTGSESLYKFLASCKAELEEGIKGLGKRSLKDVKKSDLFTYDEMMSKALGIPMAYQVPALKERQRKGYAMKRHF